MARLKAGTTWQGEIVQRLNKVLVEVKLSKGKILLFIDELHTIINNGYQLHASNIIKLAPARGELKVILFLKKYF